MLTWSIMAHDSMGRWDGGFHYEHHNHPVPPPHGLAAAVTALQLPSLLLPVA